MNNRFEDPDADATMFQVSQSSHLGNVGTPRQIVDDSIMANEENSYQENDLEFALFQGNLSTQLGNAGKSRNISDDMNLENELAVIDVNTNNVKNVICIIRSLYVLIITKYKNMIRKVTFNKFLIEKTRFDNVSTTTSLQV